MGFLTRFLGSAGTSAKIPAQARSSSRESAHYSPPMPPVLIDPCWARSSPSLRPEGFRRVVGASYREEALRRHLNGAPERLVMAQLVRDRGNSHQSGAVAVFVGSDHVGHLPREDLGADSESLYGALARLAERGVPATCWARLDGGSPDKPLVGISLFTGFCLSPDLPFPFPLTVPPEEEARVLGTDGHGALLEKVLGGRNGAQTSLELAVAELDPALASENAPVVTAAIDGVVIGALSTAESAPRLEIIRTLVDCGRTAHAKASIRRSPRVPGGFTVSVSTVVAREPEWVPAPQWKRRLTNLD